MPVPTHTIQSSKQHYKYAMVPGGGRGLQFMAHCYEPLMERIFQECVCVGLISSVHTLFLGISLDCVCDDSQTTVTIPVWPTRCVV